MTNATQKPKEQVSNLQLLIIVIASTTAFGHFVYVRLAILFAGRNDWISLIIASIIGTGIVYLHLKVAVKPNRSLIEHVLKVFGKYLGGVFSVVYLLFFTFAAAITIKVVTDFMGLIYPTTPPAVFLLFELSLVAWGVYSGVEVMARAMTILLPPMMLLGVLASLLSAKDKDFTNVYPMLHAGVSSIAFGTLAFIAMFSELVAFSVFADHASDQTKLPRQSLYLGLVLFLMFLSPATGPIMVFGEGLAKELAFPTYTEIQYIRISNIIERLDIVGILLWTIGSFFRITMFMFAAVKGMSKLLNSDRINTFTFPVLLLTAAVSLSLLGSSREDLYHFLGAYYIYIAPCVGLGLPLLTGIVYWGKKRFTGRARQQGVQGP
ncbi:GerAB/ArcD/ProY family transporter [Alicyclobacillus acidiphilus]|uniref:GerAB/ArcD/ProY family transporter n=1 Tax=Alicyclobacillus acidiphilus TaxID=182455 RepID=UPI0008340586|nr:endospore germination permease [Alicyclobacillus acidiphilus]